MSSRHILVQVPAPVAAPRAALWIGRLLDHLQRPRPEQRANPAKPRQAAGIAGSSL